MVLPDAHDINLHALVPLLPIIGPACSFRGVKAGHVLAAKPLEAMAPIGCQSGFDDRPKRHVFGLGSDLAFMGKDEVKPEAQEGITDLVEDLAGLGRRGA
jgi:hypothetical protein